MGLIPATRDGDTVLRAMEDERRASLDMRLVGHEMDGPGKLARAAEQVAALRQEPGGLQIVFCDIGLHARAGDDWSIRGELAGQLSGHGIPADAIRFPGESPSPGALADLAAECLAGGISVLIGSTRDLTRALLSRGLVTAAHHLDAPFTASDAARRTALEPRHQDHAGRTMTFRYVTDGGTDAARWQALDAGLDTGVEAFRALSGRAPAMTRRGRGTARRPARRTPPPGRGPARVREASISRRHAMTVYQSH